MRRGLLPAAMVAWALLFASATAQDDRFGFLPAGGQQLLEQVLETCDDCPDLEKWSAAERTPEEWRAHLEDLGALADLAEAEAETLVRYLSFAFPVEEALTSVEDLPPDGRTLVIFQCQTCHSIAVPILEDRDVPYWLQHRSRPPHDGIGLSDAEWRHIANYLALNAPIPEESIPTELRQGAGGY